MGGLTQEQLVPKATYHLLARSPKLDCANCARVSRRYGELVMIQVVKQMYWPKRTMAHHEADKEMIKRFTRLVVKHRQTMVIFASWPFGR
jgi:hypothetical protein